MAAAYDAIPYPSVPLGALHPQRLAAIAHLHGLNPAEPARCSVIDLGCGEATNLLAAAASLPEARCAGVDASVEAIARGRRLAESAGLGNVELAIADLRGGDWIEGQDGADYVVVHGLLSWVEPEVREATLAAASRLLSPGGVLVVTYSSLPGWDRYRPARSLVLARIDRSAGDPEQARTRAIEEIRLAAGLHGESDSYRACLEAAIERYERADPNLLYHDDLAPICEPLGLGDVAELAARHGLGYLDEALPEQWWAWRLARSDAGRAAASGEDALARQVFADHASGAEFKASVFVREEAIVGELDLERVLDLHATIRPGATEPAEGAAPATASLFASMREAFPEPMKVAALADRAGLEPETGAGAIMRLAAEERAELWLGAPGYATVAGEMPIASPLARAQLELGPRVANLRGETVEFAEPLGRILLGLLDGSRERAALARDMAGLASDSGVEGASEDRIAAVLDSSLATLADQALLVGESD